ncbi:tRNA-modifying protein YgfZ [Glaciecola sp. 1036]|uniref:tRNA-modifying protein YgfZ n=1 Tax=Alteromonadaceae TaxID=72275 RepID=UPI003D0381AA
MRDFIAELTSLRAIRVSGEESAKYLHGQLTVNTEQWEPRQSRLTAHCDFKGKMWQQSYLQKFQNDFLMIGHHQGADASIEQLKKYGVFAKVDITIAEDLFLVGASGEQAEKTLRNLFSKLPTKHLETVEESVGSITLIDISQARYLCVFTHQGKQVIDDAMSTAYAPEAYFDYLEISDCIGNVQQATCNEYVPQMFNLQLLNGIDFNKGCYMGQEVVARTKFLGKNKRALFLLEADQVLENLNAGDTLEKQIGDNWRRSGTLIRSAVDDSTTRVLAVLPNDTEYSDVLRLKDSEVTFTVLPHPYEFSNNA